MAARRQGAVEVLADTGLPLAEALLLGLVVELARALQFLPALLPVRQAHAVQPLHLLAAHLQGVETLPGLLVAQALRLTVPRLAAAREPHARELALQRFLRLLVLGPHAVEERPLDTLALGCIGRRHGAQAAGVQVGLDALAGVGV